MQIATYSNEWIACSGTTLLDREPAPPAPVAASASAPETVREVFPGSDLEALSVGHRHANLINLKRYHARRCNHCCKGHLILPPHIVAITPRARPDNLRERLGVG